MRSSKGAGRRGPRSATWSGVQAQARTGARASRGARVHGRDQLEAGGKRAVRMAREISTGRFPAARAAFQRAPVEFRAVHPETARRDAPG